jgi:hypothetical protein
MLTEFANPYQKEKGIFRRIFSDDGFDLYVWYELDREKILGFQLCYDKGFFKEQNALTFIAPARFLHPGVDEDPSYLPPLATPILVADGAPDIDTLAASFEAAAENIDEKVRAFVLATLRRYEP